MTFLQSTSKELEGKSGGFRRRESGLNGSGGVAQNGDVGGAAGVLWTVLSM